jgi:hypothetical protein
MTIFEILRRESPVTSLLFFLKSVSDTVYKYSRRHFVAKNEETLRKHDTGLQYVSDELYVLYNYLSFLILTFD